MTNQNHLHTEEKTPFEIVLGAVGVFIPQSVGLAFLFAFHNAWFTRSYGDRGYLNAVLEALRGAVLWTPSAYGDALKQFSFYTVLLAIGLLGLNALHQWKREPRELMLISMMAFVAILTFLFYQRLG